MNRRSAALIRPLGLLAAIVLAAVAGLSPSALAAGPGNNGTVKIHDGATEHDAGVVRNEPHVCTFHLHFFFADPFESGTWEIRAWSPTGDKGTIARSGTYDTSAGGEDRRPATGTYALPDGHYKLFWAGDTDKHDKMKTFWVACAPASEQPIASGSASASASNPASAVSSAGASASSSAAASPSGEELPIAGSPSPTGEELPIAGSPSPTGEELDVVGTPPPTDLAQVDVASGGDGWRVVLLGLAGVVALAALSVPAPDSHSRRGANRGRR
jgi:hypothetical protein